MTRVHTATEPAEVLTAEGERNREAWNLPRQPVQAKSHASSGAHEAAPLTRRASGAPRTIVPGLGIDRADHDTTGQELDWKGFLAAYFPGSRRHDLEALTAYGAYKRSWFVDGQSATEASRSPAAEGTSARATAVAAWEDEGGASL